MDLYRAPTLILLFVLVAVFGALWLQRRSLPPLRVRAGEATTGRRRQMLWLVGWMFVAIQLEMEVFGRGGAGIWLAVSRIAILLAAIMFLGSMAPHYFSRRYHILYVVAIAVPLILFTIFLSFDPAPGSGMRIFLLAGVFATLLVGARWSLEKHLLPVPLGLGLVVSIGGFGFWLALQQRYLGVLALAQGGILLITALLFAAAFRRVSAGVVFTVGGLVAWSLPVLLAPILGVTEVPVVLMRALNLVKVVAAFGMIVLVLEDEITTNKATQLRDRRARQEMEKYTEIFLEAMPLEENSTQYDQICEAIAVASRFSQTAIVVHSADGRFRLAGSAGFDGALAGALDAMARRTSDDKVRDLRDQLYKPVLGHLVLLDLAPLMEPGDELEQMNFRTTHGIAIRSRDQELLGTMLLTGLREPNEPLLTEDVLPLELLVARIGTAREHQLLLRRLLQSERLAGLGQLAGGVAHELNNPLTVITGYAELMTDADGAVVRDQATVILNEARRMKQIIESLIRFRKATPGLRSPVSITMLLHDIERLTRHDLDGAHIDLHLQIPADLPDIKADGDQIRQVFLQVVKNAVGSMNEVPDGIDRRLTVEAAPTGLNVQITFSDSGPGFADPARAFDPFYSTRHQGEGMGLGLSICYSIIREHGGQISALNLQPRGATVVIELPAVAPTDDARPIVGADALAGSRSSHAI